MQRQRDRQTCRETGKDKPYQREEHRGKEKQRTKCKGTPTETKQGAGWTNRKQE